MLDGIVFKYHIYAQNVCLVSLLALPWRLDSFQPTSSSFVFSRSLVANAIWRSRVGVGPSFMSLPSFFEVAILSGTRIGYSVVGLREARVLLVHASAEHSGFPHFCVGASLASCRLRSSHRAQISRNHSCRQTSSQLQRQGGCC